MHFSSGPIGGKNLEYAMMTRSITVTGTVDIKYEFDTPLKSPDGHSVAMKFPE
jgi:hypothetical protein